jgi:hypothetical protein
MRERSLEESFSKWLEDKATYLTNYTLKLIEDEWRKCGLEGLILKDLFSLWTQVQADGLRWEHSLVQFSVEKSTNWAKAMAKERNKSICHYLTMALACGHIKNFYMSMSK